MANTYTTLDGLFTGVADAIRLKNGSKGTIVADTFPSEIRNLKTGFDYNNHNATVIENYQFKNCIDLNNVNCYGIESIGISAFEGCAELKTIILYDSVKSINENAFKGCGDLTIYCMFDSQPDGWNANWNPDNCKVIYHNPIKIWDISATENDNVTAKLYMADNEDCFLSITGNGNMKSWTSFAEVPWYNYNKNIKACNIHYGVTNISRSLFREYPNLTLVNIPNSVTIIKDSVFHACPSLTFIKIPNSVTTLGVGAFAYNNIIRFTVDKDNQAYSSLDGVLFTKDIAELIAYNNNNLLDNYVVPNSVINICSYAFSGCNSLKSITIPDSVISIGNEAFRNCNNITSVYITDLESWCNIQFDSINSNPLSDGDLYLNNQLVSDLIIPNNVTSINNYAFVNCNSLISITISDSVTSIGNYAFYRCSSLTSITIPNSIINIGVYAFQNCWTLKSIIYTGTVAQWKAIIFDSGWNSNTGNYIIHCTDGDIAKDGTITYHTLGGDS